MKYNDNGTWKDIYVKTLDSLPTGAVIDYDGDTLPDGWELDDNLLWENSNPSGDFNGQTINIRENNYTYYEVIFKISKSWDYCMSTTFISGQRGMMNISDINGFTSKSAARWITGSTNKSITFDDCKYFNGEHGNTLIIPLRVVGRN